MLLRSIYWFMLFESVESAFTIITELKRCLFYAIVLIKHGI